MTRSVIVMGVSGCGKSTLGRAVADVLGWRFVEGDALHPPANISKMAAGVPLDDADRWPFLDNVASAMVAAAAGGVVASCSALKRSYRDRIRARVPDALFVLPMLDLEVLRERLSARSGHFMPGTLLESQLATLELPQADERTLIVSGTSDTVTQVAATLSVLQAGLEPACAGHSM